MWYYFFNQFFEKFGKNHVLGDLGRWWWRLFISGSKWIFNFSSKSLSLPFCRLPSSKGPPRGAQKAGSSVVHIPKISKLPRNAFSITITFKGPDHIYISFSGCSKTLSTYPEKIFELFAEPFRGNFHSFWVNFPQNGPRRGGEVRFEYFW